MFLFVPVFTYLYAVILLRRRKFKKNFSKTPFPSKKTLILFFIGQTLWHECPDYS